MTEKDFEIVCSKIDEEKSYLNSVSQDIWKMPELLFREVHAHAALTCALSKYGFEVEKHYFLTTAFRAEYQSNLAGGPTIAILLEYDALPDIGHACGHNLIAESGLAAAIGVKQAIEQDNKIAGKLIVLGTPAEEGGGGKIRLIELGAFDGVDAAMMVHPTASVSRSDPMTFSRLGASVQFYGKEAHAAAFPWEGKNALDAAVACYNNISLLRQQMKPTWRIHAIITEGGVATNIIPAKSEIKVAIRTPTTGELKKLQSQVEACINGAATVTGCTVEYSFDESDAYANLISNGIMAKLYQQYAEKLGMAFREPTVKTAGSTDMGNVSHILPSIQPYYDIPAKGGNHTKGFTEAAGAPDAQEPTLIAAKAMAMTCLTLMRNSQVLEDVKMQFHQDILKDMLT